MGTDQHRCACVTDVLLQGTYLMVALVVLLVTALIGHFWVSRILYLVIAGFGALIFSAYLMYDIQVSSSDGTCVGI